MEDASQKPQDRRQLNDHFFAWGCFLSNYDKPRMLPRCKWSRVNPAYLREKSHKASRFANARAGAVVLSWVAVFGRVEDGRGG
jgi:hypothetical protein